MGKPVNILQLAKNLGKIKTKINNDYNFEYREIGLQPGEKLNENLKDKKEILKRISNEIFMVNDKNKNLDKFQIYFEKLKENFYKGDKNKLVRNLKDIAKYC